jgi:predicted nuclease of predicted toxin-antitoxin system
MRLLLDESLPRRLGFLLEGHYVRTVVHMGWSGIKNGHLLALAAADFDVFITADQNLPYQQGHLPLAVAVLVARSNNLESLRPLVPELLEKLPSLAAQHYLLVGASC